MNFTKKLAATTAAIALTATFASAQAFTAAAAQTIDFSITATTTGDITVTQYAAATGTNTSTIAQNAATYSAGDATKVGTIEVETTMGSWDVIVNSQNDGVLTDEWAPVGTTATLGKANSADPVKVMVNVCAIKGTAADVANEAAAICDGSLTTDHPAVVVGGDGIETATATQITNAQFGALPTLTNQSIGAVLKRTAGGKFGRADVDGTTNIVYIPVYAYLNAQATDFIGNSTYTETLDFTLVSGF